MRLTPEKVWGRLLFSHWQSTVLREQFLAAMQQTPNQLLQQRLAIIARAEMPTIMSAIPCLYLQAQHDNLVTRHSIEAIQQVFPDCHIKVLVGIHFLLQINPKGAWEVISQFLKELN